MRKWNSLPTRELGSNAAVNSNALADDDGIVCLPALREEAAAEERLSRLLRQAFAAGREMESEFAQRLATGDTNDALTLALLQRNWEPALPEEFATWQQSLLEAAGCNHGSLEKWLYDKFFEQHCGLFGGRPFVWHIWDGRKQDGFHALVNYHRLAGPDGPKVLESLTYSYLGDWITRQEDEVKREVAGAEARLEAAKALKDRLVAIIEGEPPFDIFVRWKTAARTAHRLAP